MQTQNNSNIIFYVLIAVLFIITWFFNFTYYFKIINNLNNFIYQQQEEINNLNTEIKKLKNNIEKNKLTTIANVIWCEGRTSKQHLNYIASVVVNRSKSNNINDLYKVISAKGQFCCYNRKILNLQIKNKKDKELLNYTNKLVKNIVFGNFKPLINAKYFYNSKLVKTIPKFAKRPLILAFENHHFH